MSVPQRTLRATLDERQTGYLLPAERSRQVRGYVPATGWRHDVALARHLVPVCARRFSVALEVWGGRRLADLVRRSGALVLRSRTGTWRCGRSECRIRRTAQPAVS